MFKRTHGCLNSSTVIMSTEFLLIHGLATSGNLGFMVIEIQMESRVVFSWLGLALTAQIKGANPALIWIKVGNQGTFFVSQAN